ncbi:MAG TPA: HAMP domain-containing sensor histidine kinase [Gemmatimonadales bacterium]|nr:HAMP domain-containing sensor histidine kinase [Gemmatimonadales bacterium]
MTYSLQRTLAVRFAATMALGLAAASAALYWGTTAVLRGQLDQGLAAAGFLSESRIREADPSAVEPLIAADPGGYAALVNRYLVLRDRGGAVLHALPDAAASLPLDTTALRAAERGGRIWVSEVWRRRPIRSLYYPIQHGGVSGDVVLQVAALLEPLERVQRDLLLALLAVVLFGTAATFVGAWHLSSSATRPVAEITAQATHIEAGTLDQRIVAHADAEEYRGLVGVLNRMLERLEGAFHAQRRLTADVSHELRTPLTALRGEVEVALRSERSPHQYRQVLESALEEIDRLTQLTEDLLLVTRAEGRALELHRAPTDVNRLVRGTLAGLRARVESKQLVVEATLDEGLGDVQLDAALVGRVVAQLVENAVKFTPQGGRVRVATGRADGRIRIVVEDSGPGIAAEDLPHLFEPFYRADQARSRGTGLGLGLTVAAAVARLHGGTVHASNLPAGGARFELVLPAVFPG